MISAAPDCSIFLSIETFGADGLILFAITCAVSGRLRPLQHAENHVFQAQGGIYQYKCKKKIALD